MENRLASPFIYKSMKPVETMTANKWHPIPSGNSNIFPSPQSVLRSALGVVEYKFVSETVTSDHIRAAVIMPLTTPYSHLLVDVPWSMVYTTGSWRMLIVSVLDPVRWITMSRACGAVAWLKGHSITCTYNWEPPAVDEHGLKIRPPNAMGMTRPAEYHESGRLVRNDSGKARKYNEAEVLADLTHGFLTQPEIGEKHGISRITVLKIAKLNGIIGIRGNPHRVKA